MKRIALESNSFTGRSRSFTTLPGSREYLKCRRCGSSLYGRREGTTWSKVGGVRFEVEVFRCRCGAGNQVRRPVEEGAAAP
jgi:hypothetical protein